MTEELNFGALVRQIRQEKNISQRELARRSGVNRNILRRLESENTGRVEILSILVSTMGYEIGVVRRRICN
jgi:transcriptional regulator with XRE-family HTH domain